MVTTSNAYNRAALATANSIENAIGVQQRAAFDLGISGAVRSLLDTGIAGLPERASPTAYSIITTMAIHRLWEQHSRTVYAMHPEFASRLADSSYENEIPWDVFKRLAHPNPQVVYVDPLPFTDPATGAVARLLGCFAYGRAEGNHPLGLTTDPLRDRLGLLAVSEVAPGTPQADVVFTRVTVPTSGSMSLDHVVEKALQAFTPDPSLTSEDQAAMVRTLLRTMVNTLLYFCCEERDEQALTSLPSSPQQARRGSKSQRKRRTKVVQVGWRIAAEFTQAQQRYEEQRQQGPADTRNGWKQPPHIRRMHFRRVRYGAARKEVKVKLILPYTVGRTEFATSDKRIVAVRDE